MDYVRYGNTGLEVSRLCLGCMSFGRPDERRRWILDLADARQLFRTAWDSGIRFYDTANIYANGSSEEVTAALLRELGSRDDYVLASKLFFRMAPGPNRAGLSRKAIFAELDNSLKRMGTDYVDIYQIHRWDYFTPVEETLEALNDVVKSGKVRYIGASSMFAWQFAKALFTADIRDWTRFVSMQCELNLTNREEQREMLPLCEDQKVAVMAWSPLGGGRLTRPWGERTLRTKTDVFGKSMYDNPDGAERSIVDTLAGLSTDRGLPMAQLAMAWVLRQPAVTSAIIGATRPAHIEDAVASLDVSLSDEEAVALEAPYLPKPAPANISREENLRRGRLWNPAR